MPVYNISGTPYTPSDAVNVLVDSGVTPGSIYAPATSEFVYLSVIALFNTVARVPMDGSFNITETSTGWTKLMEWATRAYEIGDDYMGSPDVVDYVTKVFQEFANTSTTVPPFWKTNFGSVSTPAQTAALTYMICVARFLFKANGLGSPIPVP